MKRFLQQTFSVPFQYQVLFTDSLFKEDNMLLANLLKGKHPAKVLFVLDDGVAAAHPQMQRQIETYATLHSHAFVFSTALLLVQGGEEVKRLSVNSTWY